MKDLSRTHGEDLEILKIAYITAEEILGPKNAGGIQCCIRNLNILKQAFGEENIFVCAITKHKELLSITTDNTTTFYSSRRKLDILKNTLSGRLQFGQKTENAILEHIENLSCDVAFIEFSRMGFLQERLPEKIKQVLFMHNIEVEYIKSSIRVHPSYRILNRAFKLNETMAVKNADVIISLNYRDVKKLEEYYNRTANLILPITMDDQYIANDVIRRESNKTKLQLLFVGSLFPPNEHGITWFINEVMPYINAELSVIGKDFETLSGKLSRDNVKIIGTVDGLSHYYNSADVVVLPILTGSGMKVKTAEALMYGKPIFATDESLEGYDVEGLKNIYRCNSTRDFIGVINAYTKNPPYIRFDNSIRNLFLEKYNSTAYIHVIRELLEKQK